jgi:isopropylmalate/homocitrate/citramalate synthase
MKIAVGNSRMDKKWKNKDISWEDFCARVKTTQRTTETVEEYRKLKRGQQDDIKDVGGFVGGHLKVINEIEEYFEKDLNYKIPPKTPFVGSEFNVTKAGIHADGLLKDEEIYNSFDTKRILNKPPLVAINSYSGIASLAYWINSYYGLKGNDRIEKNDERLIAIKNEIDEEYEKGRTSNISNAEMESLSNKYIFSYLNTEEAI